VTGGLRPRQLGITPALVDSYGETVFNLSNNHQLRRGDPVRTKDFNAIAARGAELGLSDAQIAERLGLTHAQVTYIRNIMERRRFQRDHYHRLNHLGGGKRFRPQRTWELEAREAMTDSAQRLAGAMRYPPNLVKHYVAQGWWANDTLHGWLSGHAKARPDALALQSDDVTITFMQLHERVEALAAGLYALGIRPGDVVAVQLPNNHEFVLTYLAICRLGGVMSTLYLPHREAEFRSLLMFARAKAVVVGANQGDFSPVATGVALRETLPSLEHVIIASGNAVEDGTVSLEHLCTGDAPLPAHIEPHGADPFLLLFTSGTTSAPKAVPLSYQNMLSNVRLSAPEHQLDASDTILSAPPFGHLYALYSLHLALWTGATTALLPVFSPPALAACLRKHQPTALFSAPAHMAACLGLGLLDEQILSHLKLVVMSGSAVPQSVARALQGLMPAGTVSQLWGMTETQAGLYTRPGDTLDVVAGSAGRPSPGTEARIVADDASVLGPGTQGELQIRGCLLFPGYLDNPDANAACFSQDGWFCTGDLARQDAHGNITITGRIKDVINRGGVKYNPRDVEDLLDQHEDVSAAAIVPIPDAVLGERACCFITTAAGSTPTLESLCAYLTRQGISKVKLPEHLVVVDEMPLTPTRKIIKSRLPLPASARAS
jgi:cyclohexanecarboxylate-CoA ligase